MIDLKEVWRRREAEINPDLFGPKSRDIFTPDQDIFVAFGVTDPDPYWLSHGILDFAPTVQRSSPERVLRF